MSDSTQHTPDRYDELMEEAAYCKASTKGMEFTFMKDIFKLKAERDALKAQRDELLAALAFYANPGDYKAPFTGGMGSLYFDCGEKARTAIAKHKEASHG